MDTLQLGGRTLYNWGDGHFTIGGTDIIYGGGGRTLYKGGGTDTKGVVPPFLRICASFLFFLSFSTFL